MKINWTLYQQNVLGNLLLILFLVYPFYHPGFSQNCQRMDVRTIDGSCNNLRNSDWGKGDIPLARVLKANYSNRNPYSGIITNRPNPRKISNEIVSQSGSIPSKNGLSSFIFTWAQFIDHDMGLSPVGDTEANISLPNNEKELTQDITFTRSEFFPGTGIRKTAEQINELTCWIDGSQVYGSDKSRAKWLRTFKNGKLKTSKGNLLSYNTTNGEKNGRIDSNAPIMDNGVGFIGAIFVAGDKRASEQPGLTTLHILFVREHNRLCDLYRKQGISGDEKLYQLARKQVGAIIQAITYNEFLPALGVRLAAYRGYNSRIKPNMLNVFSSAAYRIGHTMVTEDLMILGDDCVPLRDNLQLDEVFFNPTFIAQLGIEPFLKGLSVQVQEEFDAKIIDGLRNFLFNIPQVPGTFGLDLASLNIQRGRDHGLSDYNSYRAHFTGKKVQTFKQINSDPAVWKKLEAVYNGKINNIDPWVGMLAEQPIPGRNMGITMHNILKKQFEDVRDGDYYFYSNDPTISQSDKKVLNKITLVDVVKRNTTLKSLQNNLFKARKCNQTTPLKKYTCNGNLIQYGNGRILLTKASNATTYFKIFDKSWRVIFQCNSNCKNKVSINNLKNGSYRVFFYNKNYKVLCTKTINLSGTSNNLIGTYSSKSLTTPITTVPTNKLTNLLYPNPAKDRINLVLHEFIGQTGTLRLFNNLGQIIKEQKVTDITTDPIQLEVARLPVGIYQLQVAVKGQATWNQKVLIQ